MKIEALNPQGDVCQVSATKKAFDIVFVPLGYKFRKILDETPETAEDQIAAKAEQPSEPAKVSEYEGMTNSELEELIEARGLEVDGDTREAFIEALEAADEQNESE